MKFLERFTLIVYSFVILLLSVILSLLIFNWIDFDVVTEMVKALITGDLSSKITLGVSVVFILLSIKCMFFDERSKEKVRETQGVLLKNENGQLMISKESIDNMVKNTVMGFEQIKQCNTKIDVNSENQLRITLFLVVNEGVVIKELASSLQRKIKEDVKRVSDLEVEEVNVKVTSLQAIIGVIIAVLILCTRLYELIVAIVLIVLGAFVGNYVQKNKDEVKDKLKKFIDRL